MTIVKKYRSNINIITIKSKVLTRYSDNMCKCMDIWRCIKIVAPWFSEREDLRAREMQRRRDSRCEWEREREADIYGRGVREALRLRDGASRFHDDARCVFPLFYLGMYLSFSFFMSLLPRYPSRMLRARLPHADTKNTDAYSLDERDEMARRRKKERSVISRLSGIAGFLKSCRSFSFRHRESVQFHETLSRYNLEIFEFLVGFVEFCSQNYTYTIKKSWNN